MFSTNRKKGNNKHEAELVLKSIQELKEFGYNVKVENHWCTGYEIFLMLDQDRDQWLISAKTLYDVHAFIGCLIHFVRLTKNNPLQLDIKRVQVQK